MHRSLLIDSDILVDHLRKDKNALDFLNTEIEKGSLLFLSVISRAEIYAGMKKGEDEVICSLFEIITPVNVDATIADKAGEYLRKFNKSHSLNVTVHRGQGPGVGGQGLGKASNDKKLSRFRGLAESNGLQNIGSWQDVEWITKIYREEYQSLISDPWPP